MNNQKEIELSFIIPAYKEGDAIEVFLNELVGELNDLKRTYEIIVLDNPVKGNSENILKKLSEENPNIRRVEIRHPGVAVADKSLKYTLGFELAKGKYIFQMDADGQDVPEEISKFLEKLDEGYDMVTGWKQNRKDSPFYVFSSRIANFLTSKLTGVKVHDMNNGFKGYKAEVAKSLILKSGYFRFIPAILTAKNYKITEVPVLHRKRNFGKGKFSFLSRVQGLFDMIAIVSVLKMGYTPFYFFGWLGSLNIFIGIIFLIISLITFIVNLNVYYSILSLVFMILFFTSSAILFIMGIILEYLRLNTKTNE